MTTATLEPDDIADRAREIYERDIRSEVEPEHIGKYLVMDVVTGAYEIDEDDIAVMKRAAARYPANQLYGMRIGYPVMGRIGVRSARGSR